MEWLESSAIQDALQPTLDKQFVDLDPIFNNNLDDDYDFRSSGVTRNSFCSVYWEWIQFCCVKRESATSTSAEESASPQTPRSVMPISHVRFFFKYIFISKIFVESNTFTQRQ